MVARIHGCPSLISRATVAFIPEPRFDKCAEEYVQTVRMSELVGTGMAVMPTLAWEPGHGDPLSPCRLHSRIRLGDTQTPGTAAPPHGRHQPRHLPHVIAGGADMLRLRYMYVDLLRGIAVEVSSSETKAGPLPEAEL